MNFYYTDNDNMQKLFPVKLDKTDTCWTYCLKRLGYRAGIFSVGGQDSIVFDKGAEAKELDLEDYISSDHNRIEEYFDLIPLGVNTSDNNSLFADFSSLNPDAKDCSLQPGDLLLFSHREKQYCIADTITANRELQYSMQKIRRHVVVYEGDGIISHAVHNFTSGTDDSSTGLQIELNSLEIYQNQPTHLLRLK